MFPTLDPDELERRIFRLCYKQTYGSGCNFTRTEVLELDWNVMELWLSMLEEQRQAEHDALSKKPPST